MGNCFSGIANLMYYAQKISYCVALVAVTFCLLVTLVVTLGVGIGMGYHYAVVEHMSLELKSMTNTTSGSSTQGSNSSNSSRRNNIFYNRRKTPLMTANATEEEVPIQKFRTNRPRRSNEQQQTNLKLNSSQMSSRCPNSLNLTTIRTIHNFSTTLNKNIGTTITIENMLLNLNTTNKMTEILNPKILAENIHFKTIKQFLGKKYENKNILVKKTESNGTRYYNDKSKDEFHTTNQKQKQLYFLKSLIQIYQKLMSNSSSSTHL